MVWKYGRQSRFKHKPWKIFLGFFVFLFFALWAILGSIVVAMIDR